MTRSDRAMCDKCGRPVNPLDDFTVSWLDNAPGTDRWECGDCLRLARERNSHGERWRHVTIKREFC